MYKSYIKAIKIIFLLGFNGFDFSKTVNAAFTTFGNVGLCFDISHFGDFNIFSKLVMSFGMLLGRLEIFPLIVLFNKNYK